MAVSQHIALNTGSLMPRITMGTYKIKGYQSVYETMRAALEAGYRSIDTAQVYGNEQDIGKALKILLPEYGIKREDIFITSKLGPASQGDKCHETCLESIRKLGVDFLDMYLIHWPGKSGLKPEDLGHSAFRKQSWQTMESLHRDGKLRAIGLSNYTCRHLEEVMAYCTVKPALLQVEHHPYLVQNDLIAMCCQHNIIYQAYASLGSMGNTKLLTDGVINEIAQKHGKTPAQVLLRWAIQQDISVIPKSTNREHIVQNIAIFNFTLTDDELSRINGLHKNEHFCWNPETVM